MKSRVKRVSIKYDICFIDINNTSKAKYVVGVTLKKKNIKVAFINNLLSEIINLKIKNIKIGSL